MHNVNDVNTITQILTSVITIIAVVAGFVGTKTTVTQKIATFMGVQEQINKSQEKTNEDQKSENARIQLELSKTNEKIGTVESMLCEKIESVERRVVDRIDKGNEDLRKEIRNAR